VGGCQDAERSENANGASLLQEVQEVISPGSHHLFNLHPLLADRDKTRSGLSVLPPTEVWQARLMQISVAAPNKPLDELKNLDVELIIWTKGNDFFRKRGAYLQVLPSIFQELTISTAAIEKLSQSCMSKATLTNLRGFQRVKKRATNRT
jgi:hypothetical protein